MRWILAVAMLLVGSASRAESLITAAKILEVTDRGFVLMVGTEPLAVEDTAETKVWRNLSTAKRDALQRGDQVYARIKTDSDPPMLREVADETTWKWLESIRKTARRGTVEKVDAKYLYLRFDDGSKFSYRITDKSDISLAGKPGTVSDLVVGMAIFVKGRLLPTLDTWVVEISDRAPAAKPAATSKSPTTKKPKPVQLPASGKLEGVILADMPPLKMFDILVDEVRTFHITYNLETKYYGDGKASDRSVLQRNLKVLVTYKRDKYGRLLASKVEVFSR